MRVFGGSFVMRWEVGLVSKVGVRFWLLLERERGGGLYFENGLYSFCPLRVLYFLS